MTTYAVETGRRVWSTLPRICAWLEEVQPAKLLVPAIAIQWLTTLGLALTVRHNGWLYYQGGDQLWYYISGWQLAHGHISPGYVGHGWPVLLAPIAALAGPTFVPALPAIVLLDVLVLGPVALLCIYGIAKQIGGAIFAYWAVALWLAVPFIGIKFTDYLYHQRYTELTLPQGFGLTAMADFPSMVAVLVSVYFALRVLKRSDLVDAVAAGLAAGVAVAIKPASAPFLGGLVLGFLYRRRFAGAAYFVSGLAPALLALALWKYRGLGYLPLFHASGAARLAAGVQQQLVAFNPLHHYVQFDWHKLNVNLRAIQEHFWSLRVVEWLVIAGLIGLARRSFTATLVVGGWFAAFVVTKGTYGQASVDDASVFRVMMPSYPAFILLLASLVYLFPGRHRARIEVSPPTPRPRSQARRRLALLAASATVFALYPLALVAAASPLKAGPDSPEYEAFGLLRSVDPSLRLNAVLIGGRVRLSWNVAEPGGAKVFYRIWRSNAPTGGATCTSVPHAAANCQLVMSDLGAHANGSFIDKPGAGTWTYRLGLAANWLNSPLYGDIFSLGPPVVVHVR